MISISSFSSQSSLLHMSSHSSFRSKMCYYFKVGCKINKCTFAHSKDELRQRKCWFNERCRNYNCELYHTGDKIPSQDELFEWETKGQFVETPNLINNNLEKTSLCYYFNVGCIIKGCTFAHSKEELKERKCRFDLLCRNDKCSFYHTGDELKSTEDLLTEAMKNMTFVDIQPPLKNVQFVIEIDCLETSNKQEKKDNKMIEIENTMKNLSSGKLTRRQLEIDNWINIIQEMR